MDLRLLRTVAANDDPPATTPPVAGETSRAKEVVGKLVFTTPGAETATVTCWALHEAPTEGAGAPTWARVSQTTGLIHNQVFSFDLKVPATKYWLQLTAITGGGPIGVYTQR